LTSVFAKLGVSSRTEAVLVALRRGWVRADIGVQKE
jgi:DNA-binding NarL/FixJ family response regulator